MGNDVVKSDVIEFNKKTIFWSRKHNRLSAWQHKTQKHMQKMFMQL